MTFPCSTCKVEFATDAEEFTHDCERLVSQIPNAVRYGVRSNGFGGTTSTRVDKPMTSSAATDKQLAFLRKLCDEHGINHADMPTTKAAVSARIDKLIATPKVGTLPVTPRPATVRSNRYAGNCVTCTLYVAEGTGRIEQVNGRWATFHLDGTCVPATKVTQAKATPVKRVTEDGFYRDAATDTIFKVQVAHHGSGNLYAKRLVLPTPEQIDHARALAAAGDKAGSKVKGQWIYEAGLISKLKPEWKLDAEQARAWGQVYGVCCRCAAVLTDEHSIAAGIGPVCATKGF